MVYVKVDNFLGTDIFVDTDNSKFFAQGDGYNRMEGRTIAEVRRAMDTTLPTITLTRIEDDHYRDYRQHDRAFAAVDERGAYYPARDGYGAHNRLTGQTNFVPLKQLYEPNVDRDVRMQEVRDDFKDKLEILKTERMEKLTAILNEYAPITLERAQELLADAKETRHGRK